jgi:hypothetical protein
MKKSKNMVELKIPEKLPLLEGLCWNIANPYQLTPQEMLGIYEERWGYKEVLGTPTPEEIAFIKEIVALYHGLPLIPRQNMTKNEFYQCVKLILNHLNPDILNDYQTYLGGGTLIAFKHSQIRLSSDLDFLNKPQNFNRLKIMIAQQGAKFLFKPNPDFIIDAPRINKYNIRFPIRIKTEQKEFNLKLEIVAEYSLELDPPDKLNQIPCLNLNDRVAAKLLANADRWCDRNKFSRDLIDLAIISSQHDILPQPAINKAEQVYPVIESLTEAIKQFQALPNYRQKCYEKLQISRPDLIINGLDKLACQFDLLPTERGFGELDFTYLESPNED